MTSPVPLGCSLALVAVFVGGCASAASRSATPTPTPAPAASPTPDVAFAIQVTPLPTPRPPKPRPKPTQVVHHVGPYLQLSPTGGPPAARQITVLGGNLPPSSPVLLAWAPNGRQSPISTSAYTSRTGSLHTTFSVPGTAPGMYRIVAEVNGIPYASAPYTVRSFAALSVVPRPTGSGVRLQVSGRRFLARLSLALVLYSVQGELKPSQVGEVKTSGKGSFSLLVPTRRLPPGQYVLRAWPIGPLAAQTVETYFQVVL